MLSARAARAALTLIDRRQGRLERAGQLLAALSYHGVLARGFALVRAEDGRPLRTAAAVGPAMRLDIEFADGHVRATSEGAAADSAKTDSTPSGDAKTGGTAPGGATAAGTMAGGTIANGTRWSVQEKPPAEPHRPKPRRSDNPGQGSLF